MTSRLTARLNRLQPACKWVMVLHPQEGETDQELRQRAAALGYPVAVMPKPCKTIEEWISFCRAMGYPAS